MNYRPRFCRPVETLSPRHTVGISVGDLGVTRVDRAALPMPSAAGNDAGRVLGRLRTRSWETPDGDKRTSTEIDADEVAPSPRSAARWPLRLRSARSGLAIAERGQFNDEPPTY
jgi:Single-strand binding protein family